MNAGPSSSSPAGVNPAEIMALYPVDNVPAHPRSMSPPHGAKSTTTISPVVVLQLLKGSAAAEPECQMPPATQKVPIKATIARTFMSRRIRVMTEVVPQSPDGLGRARPAAIPTIGSLSLRPPIDPWYMASPKLKTPPSDATSQYPSPSGVEAIPTIGSFSLRPPIDPRYMASPKLKTPPSDATSQYPLPSGVEAIPTIGSFSLRPPIDPRYMASPKLKTPPSDATSQYPLPSGVEAIPT